jgi:hypothetical protein
MSFAFPINNSKTVAPVDLQCCSGTRMTCSDVGLERPNEEYGLDENTSPTDRHVGSCSVERMPIEPELDESVGNGRGD